MGGPFISHLWVLKQPGGMLEDESNKPGDPPPWACRLGGVQDRQQEEVRVFA